MIFDVLTGLIIIFFFVIYFRYLQFVIQEEILCNDILADIRHSLVDIHDILFGIGIKGKSDLIRFKSFFDYINGSMSNSGQS